MNGKSARKSAPGRPFSPGEDRRRGRGPRPGAPNAGRPRRALRQLALQSFADQIPTLLSIAAGEPVVRVRKGKKETEITVSAAPGDRIRAIDVLGKYGLGTAMDVTSGDKPLRKEPPTKVLIFGKEVEL